MDLIGAILAGAEVGDKAGMPQLMSALTQNIQNFDPATVAAIQEALGTNIDFAKTDDDVVTVIEGQDLSQTGPGSPRAMATMRFLEANTDLGSGQLRYSDDGLTLYNSIGGKVAKFNSTTGEYERN